MLLFARNLDLYKVRIMTVTINTATPDVNHVSQDDVSRRTVFLHSLAFVVGFGFIFTLLGSAAGLLGNSLFEYLPTMQRVGAVLLLIFGLITIGAFRWAIDQITAATDLQNNPAAKGLVSVLSFLNALMYTEKRVTEMHSVKSGLGYVSSFLMGVSFSAGWVPCVGPILASILFIASDSATAAQGAILLAIYSLGLGIPFLITGAAFGSATKFLRSINRHLGIVSIVSGIFLLFVAYLLWFDKLGSLTQYFFFLNEWVFLLEERFSSFVGESSISISNVNVVSSAPIALIAGVISFISPCVLPLVPAYIGYLSGASLNNS